MKKRVLPKSIRETMTLNPMTVRQETTIAELLALFDLYDYNGFPVVEGDNRLRGVVTKLDLLRAFRSRDYLPLRELRVMAAERVVDIMTRGVVSVEPDDPVTAAIDLMVEFGLRSLPVVERHGTERVLVGVVSRKDLLRWLRLEDEDKVA